MDPFIWRVILSFIIGGSYAATLIWISERFGTRIGGILTGIPTTVFIGLTFISLTAGRQAAHKAALLIPAMAGVSLVLVYCFTRFMHLKTQLALLIAVSIWFVIALLFVNLHFSNILLTTLCGVTLLVITKRAMRHYASNLKASGKTLRKTYLFRILGAGSVIAFAVVIAKLAGPVWGGVFAAFPATFVTTLYMLRIAQGTDFAKAVARQLPLANGSTMTFALVFYLLILRTSLVLTVLASIAGSLLYAIALLKYSTARQ